MNPEEELDATQNEGVLGSVLLLFVFVLAIYWVCWVTWQVSLFPTRLYRMWFSVDEHEFRLQRLEHAAMPGVASLAS